MAHQWTHGGFCQPPPQPAPPTPLPLATNNSQSFGWNPWAYATAAPQAPYGEATLEWPDMASWSNPWVVDPGTTSQVALNSIQTANHTNVSPHEIWDEHYYQSASPSEYLAAATWDGSAYIAPSAVYHDQQALQHGWTPPQSLSQDLFRTETLASSQSSSMTISTPPLVTIEDANAPIARRRRDRQWCEQCNSQPEGFRTFFELERHNSIFHATAPRKVWVCKDISEGQRFLAWCGKCSKGRKYNKNYNAAAHLRRVHFNPKETTPGRPRAGGAGGKDPPMQYLRLWMDEQLIEPEPQRRQAGVRRP